MSLASFRSRTDVGGNPGKGKNLRLPFAGPGTGLGKGPGRGLGGVFGRGFGVGHLGAGNLPGKGAGGPAVVADRHAWPRGGGDPPSARSRLERQGVPVSKFDSLETARQVGQLFDELERKGVLELRQEFKTMFLPELDLQDKDALCGRLQEWLVWAHLPQGALEQECVRCRVPEEERAVTGDDKEDQRTQLLERLLVHAWCRPAYARRGLPLDQIGDAHLALQVVHECERQASLSMGELRKLHSDLGFVEAKGITRQEFVGRLQAVTVWNVLPVEALRQQCEERQLLGSEEDAASKDRDEFLRKLYGHMCPASLVPVERFPSVEAASAVGVQCMAFARMSVDEMRRQLEEWSIPLDEGLPKDDYLSRLRCAAMWAELPARELEKECAELDVAVEGLPLSEDDEKRQQQLLDVLVYRLNGVPVARFGSLDGARRVAGQVLALKQMTVAQMKTQCEEWNVPLPEGSCKNDYFDRLHTAIMFSELPVGELAKECEEWGLVLSRFDLKEDSTIRREQLMEIIFAGLNNVPVDRFNSIDAVSAVANQYIALVGMSLEEVKRQYREWNMPESGSVTKETYLSRLQYAVLWWELPLAELKKDCREWGITDSELQLSGDADEQRGKILDHLLYCLCWETFEAMGVWVTKLDSCSAAWTLHAQFSDIDAMNTPDLRAKYEGTGLSAHVLQRAQLADRLKHVAYWLTMSFHELQQECREHRVDSIATQGDQQELASRLLNRLWGPDASRPQAGKPPPPHHWAFGDSPHSQPGGLFSSWGPRPRLGGGMPGRQAQASAVPRAAWPRGSMNGGPSRPPWWGTAGPPGGFSLGGKGFGKGVLPPGKGGGRGGCSATSAGARPGRPPSGASSGGAAASNASGGPAPRHAPSQAARPAEAVTARIAAHFQALGLPTTAGPDDIKRAYRRLALRFHPDKNRDGSASSAQEFLNVSAAYSAAMDHVKAQDRRWAES